jgi:hypothetical protein
MFSSTKTGTVVIPQSLANVVIIPVVTIAGSTTYLILISRSGSVLARIAFPSSISNGAVTYHRYGQFLYVIPSGALSIFKFDLSSLTASTISAPYDHRATSWVRYSATQLIRVGIPDSTYKVLDMTTGNITSTSYTAASTTGWTGSVGITGFYDKTVGGLTNFGNRLYWEGATGVSFNGEVNVASISGGALGTRTALVTNISNYSRSWGAIGNSSTAMVTNSWGMYKVSNASNSAALWNLASNNITYNSNSYGQNNDGQSPLTASCLTSNLRMYQSFGWYNNSTSTYQFVLGTYDFSQNTGTQTPTFVLAFPVKTGNYSLQTTTCVQVSSDGKVAVLYQDPSSNYIFKLATISGSTVISTVTVDVGSAYSSGVYEFCSTPISELGIYDAT